MGPRKISVKSRLVKYYNLVRCISWRIDLIDSARKNYLFSEPGEVTSLRKGHYTLEKKGCACSCLISRGATTNKHMPQVPHVVRRCNVLSIAYIYIYIHMYFPDSMYGIFPQICLNEFYWSHGLKKTTKRVVQNYHPMIGGFGIKQFSLFQGKSRIQIHFRFTHGSVG